MSAGGDETPMSVTVDASSNGDLAHAHSSTSAKAGFWALALGSVGVVYGDIGTSPLYALREALFHAREGGVTREEVLGVTSLLLWALIFIVTCKYVLFLMRADNIVGAGRSIMSPRGGCRLRRWYRWCGPS